MSTLTPAQKEVKLYLQQDNVWIKTNIKGFKFKVPYFRRQCAILIEMLDHEKSRSLLHSFDSCKITNKDQLKYGFNGNVEFGEFFIKISHIRGILKLASSRSNAHNW